MRIIFLYTINFDEVALKNIERDYQKDKCSEVQSKLIMGITKIICDFINIPVLAMKVTALKALKEWETRNNCSITAISGMPVGKRLNAVKEIFSIGKKMVKNMVSDPKEKNEILIDISFEKAFKYFLGYYSRNQGEISFSANLSES
ncbi:MAG: hypothetical protein ACFE94_10955 [Candidatus Hodarchaeota archaeon]